MTFEPGETSAFVSLLAISDGLYEGVDESVILIGRSRERTVENESFRNRLTVNIMDTDSE